MPPARSVAILLTTAALAGPAAAFGQGAGGAGDDQYQDPFSPSGSSGSTTGSQTSDSSSSGTVDSGLTQDPNLGLGGSSSTSSTGSTGTSLPNTGSDPRLIVLAGLALLLSGLGLRLRTADEQF